MTPLNTSTLPQEEDKGNLSDWFRVSAPGIEGVSGMEWDTFQTAALVTSEKGQCFFFETKKCFTKSGKPLSYVGKIVFLKNGLGEDHAAVFLCSPNVDTLEQMYDQGVSVQDLKGRDDCRLQMLLNQANLDHFQSSSSEVIASSCFPINVTSIIYSTKKYQNVTDVAVIPVAYLIIIASKSDFITNTVVALQCQFAVILWFLHKNIMMLQLCVFRQSKSWTKKC